MITWLRGEITETRKPIHRWKAWQDYTPPPTRRCKRCPRCGNWTGVFLAACTRETAMYHCAAGGCSAMFERERPRPL